MVALVDRDAGEYAGFKAKAVISSTAGLGPHRTDLEVDATRAFPLLHGVVNCANAALHTERPTSCIVVIDVCLVVNIT